MPSHRSSQLTCTLAAGLAAATLAASPAAASPMLEPGPTTSRPCPSTARREVTTIDQGFDWGSAAIGAGGAGAVLVLGRGRSVRALAPPPHRRHPLTPRRHRPQPIDARRVAMQASSAVPSWPRCAIALLAAPAAAARKPQSGPARPRRRAGRRQAAGGGVGPRALGAGPRSLRRDVRTRRARRYRRGEGTSGTMGNRRPARSREAPRSWCSGSFFCSDVFEGVSGEAAQRECAIAGDQTVQEIDVTVDHGPAVAIRRPRYEALAPQTDGAAGGRRRTDHLRRARMGGADPPPAPEASTRSTSRWWT